MVKRTSLSRLFTKITY